MIFYGKIKRGRLGIINKAEVDRQISEHGDADLVKITVEVEDGRSLSKNAYLHKILIPGFRKALRKCGNVVPRTDAEAKEILKKTFLKQSVYVESKQDYEDIVRDTSSLNEQEMKELIEEVIRFCAVNMEYKIKFPGEKKWKAINTNDSTVG